MPTLLGAFCRLHTRIETTFHVVYISWIFSSQEGEDGAINGRWHGVCFFCDVKGILLGDYLEKVKTIGKIKTRHTGKKAFSIRTLHLSTKPSWRMGKLICTMKCSSRRVPYSPGLNLSDFPLWRKITIFLTGESFSSIQEIIVFVDLHFGELPAEH